MIKSRSKYRSRRNWKHKFKIFSNQLPKTSAITRTTWMTQCHTRAIFWPLMRIFLFWARKIIICNRIIWFLATIQIIMEIWYNRVMASISTNLNQKQQIRFIIHTMAGKSKLLIKMHSTKTTWISRTLSILAKWNKAWTWSKTTPSTNNTAEPSATVHLTVKTARRPNRQSTTKQVASHQIMLRRLPTFPSWLSRPSTEVSWISIRSHLRTRICMTNNNKW